MKKISGNFLCLLFRKFILKPIGILNIAHPAAYHRPDIGIYELPLGSTGRDGDVQAEDGSDYFDTCCQFQSSNVYRIFYDLNTLGNLEVK
jgi:hypothetical protein